MAIPMTEREQHEETDAASPPRGGVWLGAAGTVMIVAELVWLSVHSARIIDRGGDPWQTGDWLINLAAGPMRRGIFGELLFRVVDSSNVLWLTFGVQIALLAMLTAFTLVLFWNSPRTTAWFMLVFSPAFLLFPSLSPDGALRKELFALAAMALLAVTVRFRWPAPALIGVVALFALGATAHEMTALTLPAFVYLVASGHRLELWGARTMKVTIGALAAIAVAGVAWAALFPATSTDTSKICASWVDAGLDRQLCSGALQFHSRTFSQSLDLTRGMFPSYLSLVPLAVLSVMPFVALRVPRRIWWTLAVTFVALAPLFFVGIDYGRWIYTGIALTSLVCLATWTHGDFAPTRVPVWIALLFVALWSLPSAGPQTNHSLLTQVLSDPIEHIVGTPSDRPIFSP
jgi:hypothetical protein